MFFCDNDEDYLRQEEHFWFLVTLATKLQKYYVIFVYIVQGKMGKTEKNGKKITQLN